MAKLQKGHRLPFGNKSNQRKRSQHLTHFMAHFMAKAFLDNIIHMRVASNFMFSRLAKKAWKLLNRNDASTKICVFQECYNIKKEKFKKFIVNKNISHIRSGNYMMKRKPTWNNFNRRDRIQAREILLQLETPFEHKEEGGNNISRHTKLMIVYENWIRLLFLSMFVLFSSKLSFFFVTEIHSPAPQMYKT